MNGRATITRRGEDRIRAGHVWVYRSDVAAVEASPGDTVAVFGSRGRPIGHGLYSDRSQIALRMLSDAATPADLSLWQERLSRAIAYRESLNIDATAYRLVHGEADLLPSLIVDRYGDYLVVQTLSQGTDRLLPEIARMLVELAAPAGIVARNDAKVRQLEGLTADVAVLHGSVPGSVSVREGSVIYDVDLEGGQKTGLFLDQRENRAAAATYGRGRVLDCFSYHGGFALHLAPHAEEVTAVDISEHAVAQIVRNASRNGASNVRALQGNVFDVLRELEREGRRFDTIVLDPPAFAKQRGALERAIAGYKEINLRALKLLTHDGILVTCTCSYHVDEATFGQIVYDAAADAHTRLTVVEKRMQSRDHPILLGVPETYYLKCFILRVIERPS